VGGEVQLCCFMRLFILTEPGASMGTSPEEIEKQLASALEASGSLNGIADLLALVSPAIKPPQLQHKAIYALYRTYTLVFTTRRLDVLRTDPSPPTQAVRQWLLQKLEQFLSLLTQQFRSPEPSISVSSITWSPESSHPFFFWEVRFSASVIFLIAPALCRTLQQQWQSSNPYSTL